METSLPLIRIFLNKSLTSKDEYLYSGDSSRIDLLLAAERLAGETGLDAVSARAIAREAGARNNSAVRYHFHSLENLFNELIIYRISYIESLRRNILDYYNKGLSGISTVKDVAEIICIPHLSMRGAGGNFPYATFLCQFLPRRYAAVFPDVIVKAGHNFPVMTQAVDCYRQIMNHLPGYLIDRRMNSSSLLFLNILRSLGKVSDEEIKNGEIEELLDDGMRQVCAIMNAPYLEAAPISDN